MIDESQRQAARVAGLMYLLMMVTGLFAEVYGLWLLVKGARAPGIAEPAVSSGSSPKTLS